MNPPAIPRPSTPTFGYTPFVNDFASLLCTTPPAYENTQMLAFQQQLLATQQQMEATQQQFMYNLMMPPPSMSEYYNSFHRSADSIDNLIPAPVSSPEFGPEILEMSCVHCQALIRTAVTNKLTNKAKLRLLMLCGLPAIFPCCWCVKLQHEYVHTCPVCHKTLGTYTTS